MKKVLKYFFDKAVKIYQLFFGQINNEELEMTWDIYTDLEEILCPNDYFIRQFDFSSDINNYLMLLDKVKMYNFPLEFWKSHILPDGFFVVVYKTNNSIVGACFASHFPTDRYEFAGNLGWLAVDPEHRGMNLGELLVGKVVNRLKKAGYKLIYLGTQDFRVPAIKLYFKTGWSPNLYNEEMSIRWKKICKQLNIEFKEKEWSITK